MGSTVCVSIARFAILRQTGFPGSKACARRGHVFVNMFIRLSNRAVLNVAEEYEFVLELYKDDSGSVICCTEFPLCILFHVCVYAAISNLHFFRCARNWPAIGIVLEIPRQSFFFNNRNNSAQIKLRFSIDTACDFRIHLVSTTKKNDNVLFDISEPVFLYPF